jgi:CRP-like cAMP-binding protein
MRRLKDNDKRVLFDAMVMRGFNPGENIITQGEVGGNFYLIKNGEVEVLTDKVLKLSLGEGCSFGEWALIYGCPRIATVTHMCKPRRKKRAQERAQEKAK